MISEHADIDAVLNMAPTDQETKSCRRQKSRRNMPLPSDPKVIFLGGLFVLALLAAAYVASEIVLPLVFAIVLKLLLQPALRSIGAVAHTANTRGAAADPRACSERSSAWARPFQAPPAPGQPSFQRAFLGFRSG